MGILFEYPQYLRSLKRTAVVAGKPRRPVESFAMAFTWQDEWTQIFDKQVELLREDIARARVEDRVIVYLSCPISPRGGGFSGTNVEIANHTQRRLMNEFGHRFWFLNPAQYQMESKEGVGLIIRHARALGMSEEELRKLPKPSGGDYMRMWTRVLVEDDADNLGAHFDGFYFVGPNDVRSFLTEGGSRSVTAGVEEFFARQYTMNVEFRDAYSVGGIEWRQDWSTAIEDEALREEAAKARQVWEDRRKAFFRYYGLRAGAAFSLGSHDEWNIFRLLNEMRLQQRKGDVGELLAGYFDGRQLSMGSAAARVQPGYEVV